MDLPPLARQAWARFEIGHATTLATHTTLRSTPEQLLTSLEPLDDEPLAREGLRGLLTKDVEISAIHEARDGREAIAAI